MTDRFYRRLDRHHPSMLYLCRVGKIPIYIHWSTLAFALFVVIAENLLSDSSDAYILFGFALIPAVLHATGTLLVLFDFRTNQSAESLGIWPIGGFISPRRSVFVEDLSNHPQEVASTFGGLVFLLVGCIASFVFPLDVSQSSSPFFLLYFREILFGVLLLHLTPVFPFAGQIFVTMLLSSSTPVDRSPERSHQIENCFVALLFLAALIFESYWFVCWGVFSIVLIFHSRIRRDIAELLAGKTVRDMMIPLEQLPSFTHGTTLAKAARLLVNDPSPLFCVKASDSFLGLVTRDGLRRKLAAFEADAYIRDALEQRVGVVHEHLAVNEFIARFGFRPELPYLVMGEDSTPLGVLTSENLYDRLLCERVAPSTKREHSTHDTPSTRKPRDSRLDEKQ
ncbi:MAG: hypothetical protein KDD64_05835 [Bdellovibrionales bacterium]|nr:hypothetical protein [Bdellovibrionales bacterium]